MPLSSTYETGQEPAYFPTPYAASRVPGYNRESCVPPGVGNQQNMGTFGSSRSGYTYDIPYPRKVSISYFFFILSKTFSLKGALNAKLKDQLPA